MLVVWGNPRYLGRIPQSSVAAKAAMGHSGMLLRFQSASTRPAPQSVTLGYPVA